MLLLNLRLLCQCLLWLLQQVLLLRLLKHRIHLRVLHLHEILLLLERINNHLVVSVEAEVVHVLLLQQHLIIRRLLLLLVDHLRWLSMASQSHRILEIL